MVTVRVPATSANLGSGFDSVGIALQIYNTITVREIESGLIIDILDETSNFLPHDKRNLVYRAMEAVFNEVDYKFKGIHIIQKNNIPVIRGLGSSSASIVGGLIAANEISGRHLSKDRLISLASQIEGHPDNVTPSITGGMSIAVLDTDVHYLSVPIDEDKLRFALFIPGFILRTKKSRSVLPLTVPHSDAVFNTGRAALLVASIITGNYDNLKVAMQDKLHQPYRKSLINGIENIFNKSNQFGALGSYISGAGPTIISIINASDEQDFKENMMGYLNSQPYKWDFKIIKPDNKGAQIIEGGN